MRRRCSEPAGRRRASLGCSVRRCRTLLAELTARNASAGRHCHRDPHRAGGFGPARARILRPLDRGARQGRPADRRRYDGEGRRAGKTRGQGLVVLDGQCTDPAGQLVATAMLEVLAPTKRLQREMPEHRLEGLLERCRGLKPMLTGVVHPCSAEALAGTVEAAEAGLIVPVLFGPEARTAADRRSGETRHFRHARSWRQRVPENSALKAAMAAGAGEVQALMKGSLHTDVLLHAIMQKEAKLRTGRLLSHCAMMSVPTYARRIIISDVALNIAPDTDQKRDICQNAIGFARALGIDLPKVAVLAAVEMVSTKMQATLDGAILAKMADRRQIVGGIVDGPLDLDAAVDAEAARDQAYSSPVAGARRYIDRAKHRSRQHGLQEPGLHGRCADRGPGGRRACAGHPDQPSRHRRLHAASRPPPPYCTPMRWRAIPRILCPKPRSERP